MRMRMASLSLPLLAALAGACGGGKARVALPPAPIITNVFADAPPYASAPVARSAAAAHAAKGVPAASMKTACLSCHKSGASAPAFSLGGTVWADNGGTQGAADVEVRVLDAKGQPFVTRSDADGNFWLASAAAVAPIHAGVRNGAKVALMEPDVSTANCNDCHDAKLPMVLK